MEPFLFIYCDAEVSLFDTAAFEAAKIRGEFPEEEKYITYKIKKTVLRITPSIINYIHATDNKNETQLVGYNQYGCLTLMVPFDMFTNFVSDKFGLPIWDLTKAEVKNESKQDVEVPPSVSDDLLRHWLEIEGDDEG